MFKVSKIIIVNAYVLIKIVRKCHYKILSNSKIVKIKYTYSKLEFDKCDLISY
jgi:hypothetical protein